MCVCVCCESSCEHEVPQFTKRDAHVSKMIALSSGAGEAEKFVPMRAIASSSAEAVGMVGLAGAGRGGRGASIMGSRSVALLEACT